MLVKFILHTGLMPQVAFRPLQVVMVGQTLISLPIRTSAVAAEIETTDDDVTTTVESEDAAGALEADTEAAGKSQTSTAPAGARTRADVIDVTTVETEAGTEIAARAVIETTIDDVAATSTTEEEEVAETAASVMHTEGADVRSASAVLRRQLKSESQLQI